MTIISETYLVTIKIDTERARNFPDGFKEPAWNNGDNGYNWNSHPNWDINYLNLETDFINMVWMEFESSFDYDGLNCRVTRVRYDQ